MTTKQVKTAPAAAGGSTTPNNLYISVKTFDAQGKDIGFRIVDMFHYGTRNWLSNHLWWATHNGHCVEVNTATPPEIENYLAEAKVALAAKFNASAPIEEPAGEPVAKAA